MPVYTEVWDEAIPGGSRSRALGDDDIRAFKRAWRERFAHDHIALIDESTTTHIGRHKKITFAEIQTADPANEADVGFLYLKDVSGVVELFWEDESGNVVQVSKAGKLAVLGSEGFRSGDLLFSSSEATPTGWSDVSTTYNNKFIRITSSAAPLTTGGADTHSHAAGDYKGPAHTHGPGTYAVPNNVSCGYKSWGDSGYLAASYSGPGDMSTPQANGEINISGDSASSGTASITGTSAVANNIPAYVAVRCYKKD